MENYEEEALPIVTLLVVTIYSPKDEEAKNLQKQSQPVSRQPSFKMI